MEGLPGGNLTEGPGGGSANEGLRVVEAAREGGDGRNAALIAEDDSSVAQDAATTGSPEGRAAEASPERFVVEIEKRDEINW